MQKVCIIIPTFNESENIISLLERIFQQKIGYDIHVIIVDDGSNDGTSERINKLAETNKKISIIQREGKKGLGSAIIEGYRSMYLRKIRPDYVVTMDGDLSHDPDELHSLIQRCSSGTLVIGSRFVRGGRVVSRSWLRKIFSSLANSYARMFLGIDVHDSTSGYRCYSPNVLETVLPDLKATGYGFQIEVLFHTLNNGFTVIEVPITFRNRVHGESKLGLRQVWEFILEVLRVRNKSR